MHTKQMRLAAVWKDGKLHLTTNAGILLMLDKNKEIQDETRI